MVHNTMRNLSRRDFLKAGTAGFAAIALPDMRLLNKAHSFPVFDELGRVCGGKVDLKLHPDADSAIAGVLYEDAVVPCLREVVGSNRYRINQRWIETPEGYIWSPHLQKVSNLPNEPILSLPETSLGAGMWVEVTVPWVDLILANPPARSPWLEAADNPRLYFSQILWVDEVKKDDIGTIWYRVNERYGYGDIFWAEATAFRPLTSEEVTPIHPDVEQKLVQIDVTYQTMACFEDEREVYFCRISTGAKFNAQGQAVDKWSTPLGKHPIWRKAFSMHMSGGTVSGGYDLPGIGWTTLFVGNGVAIHSTFWHNNFGVPMSHGCVNAEPDDAKWIFRWVDPPVASDPGDITVSMPGGTKVEVIES